ncbi:hypothetical protein DFS34DRAFT_607627 [Phlyctochytrium arcticum]|nr:hypothetical protein DFS34DRAFT_607627 [Phlyctochytrium arcticum]
MANDKHDSAGWDTSYTTAAHGRQSQGQQHPGDIYFSNANTRPSSDDDRQDHIHPPSSQDQQQHHQKRHLPMQHRIGATTTDNAAMIPRIPYEPPPLYIPSSSSMHHYQVVPTNSQSHHHAHQSQGDQYHEQHAQQHYPSSVPLIMPGSLPSIQQSYPYQLPQMQEYIPASLSSSSAIIQPPPPLQNEQMPMSMHLGRVPLVSTHQHHNYQQHPLYPRGHTPHSDEMSPPSHLTINTGQAGSSDYYYGSSPAAAAHRSDPAPYHPLDPPQNQQNQRRQEQSQHQQSQKPPSFHPARHAFYQHQQSSPPIQGSRPSSDHQHLPPEQLQNLNYSTSPHDHGGRGASMHRSSHDNDHRRHSINFKESTNAPQLLPPFPPSLNHQSTRTRPPPVPPPPLYKGKQSISPTENASSAPPSQSISSSAVTTASHSNTAKRRDARKKKTLEYAGVCRQCNSTIAYFNLRGDPAIFESKAVLLDLLCSECMRSPTSGDIVSPGTRASLGGGGRKRARTEEFECEICKRVLAYGYVGTASESASELNISVEVVCLRCKGRFGFCGSCGGGGKYRTGKYRPIELFPRNRKTCLLSHVRIGDAPLHYEIYTGEDIPLDQLGELAEVYQDAFLALYATPRVMQEVPAFINFSDLNNFLRHAWTEAVANILRPITPESKSVALCAVAWIIKSQQQRKPKGGPARQHCLSDVYETGGGGDESAAATAASSMTTPPPSSSATGGLSSDWNALRSQGNLSHYTSGASSGAANSSSVLSRSAPSTSAGPVTRSTPGQTVDHCYVGVCASSHQFVTQSLLLLEVGVMQSVQSHGIAQHLILLTIDRIRALHPNSPLRYVWYLTRKINLPMQRFSEKCGLMLKEVFERTYPETNKDTRWFVREEYDMDQYITYVGKISDVLARIRRKDAKAGPNRLSGNVDDAGIPLTIPRSL